MLNSPAAARPRVLAVHGPAGGGHPDLIQELLETQKADSATVVLRADCSLPQPFVAVLQQLVDSSPDLDVRKHAASALSARPSGSELASLLERTGRDRRGNWLESVRQVLRRAAAAHNTLVCAVATQDADADTTSLLHYLVEDAAGQGVAGIIGRVVTLPTYVLCMDDDAPAGRALLRSLKGQAAVQLVTVQPLDADGLARVISEPDNAKKLLRITGGLPSRVRRVVELLPEDIDQLADARLARLSDAELQILQLAHVADTPLLAGPLAVLSGQPRFSIQSLARRGFLTDSADGLTVADAWVGASALEPTADRRAALHAQVATHLTARLLTLDDAGLYEPITRHLLAAGDSAGAVEHALQAATHLRREHATGRAVALLETVAEHCGMSAPLVSMLVRLDSELGEFDRALHRIEALDGEADCTLLVQRAELQANSGQLDATHSALSKLALSTELTPELAERVTTNQVSVLFQQGLLDEAQSACETALAGPLSAQAEFAVRNTLQKIAFRRGDWPLAESIATDLMTRFGRDDERMRATALHNLALVHIQTGRHGQAVAPLQEAVAVLESLADHFLVAVALHNLAIAYEYHQRYALAIPLLQRSVEVMEHLGRRFNLVGAVITLGDTYLTLGEHWRARKLLEYAVSIAEDNGQDYYRAVAVQKLAAVELAEGRAPQAIERATDALRFLTEAQASVRAEAHLTLGRAHAELGQRADARRELTAAGRVGNDEVKARAAVGLARLELDAEPYDVHRDATAAADTLLRLGQRDGVIDALSLAARAARRAGEEAALKVALTGARAASDELLERVPEVSREAFMASPLMLRLGIAESENLTTSTPAPRKIRTPERRDRYFRMVGRSKEMQHVFGMIERLGDVSAPILVLGESGTGKELVAEAICKSSQRKNKPFIRVNAAAFVDTLLESELFGHEKGAFTGATARKLGAFEQADGGTLFLDEIGDISHKTQVSLLRVLQEKELRRVGGRRPVHVDVRIICATNRNLEAMVEAGEFRLDLYYRIKGLTVSLPPLRDRGDDLMMIAEHLLSRLSDEHGRQLTLAPDAVDLLTSYRWPGNVRELENVLRSVFFFARTDAITAEELTSYTLLRDARCGDMGPAGNAPQSHDDGPLTEGFDLNEAKRQLEITCITKALDQTGGNITQAAGLLGMKRPRLSQKIKEYGLKVSPAGKP